MAFNLPLQNFFSRTTGPAVYSRPSDWPVITDVATEVQFLFCDLGDAACQIRTTFTRTSGSQNIVIDWGDATTSTVTTTGSTNTTHTYTPGTGTPCSLGYTTFIIRVYFTGTGVSVLNNCNIMPIPISGDITSFQSCAVLEAYYGNSTQNATVVNFNSQGSSNASLGVYSYLQFVKLPATVSWTQWNNAFYNCIALLKVVMPTSNSAATQYSSAFFGCYNLLELTIPSNSTGITTFGNAFQNCYNLRSVTLPTTLNSCNTFSTCFYACYNLRSVTLPSVNVCNSFQLTFYQCTQLEWVKFTSMPTVVGAISMNNAFGTCTNLQNVYFPATGTATSIYDFSFTFSQCYQLKNIVLPSNINVSTFGSTFVSCHSLTSCILPTSAAACTTYANIFYLCYSLLKITLPAAPTAAVSISDAFNQCWKLQEITIPSGYVFTSMSTICTNCFSLKTFTWTPGTQNSLTSLVSAFNGCVLLTSITMPSSMNSLTTLGTAFNLCISLSSITFPSSLNAVTTMQQCFAGCRLLKSVTLPTSMSSCTHFGNIFADCSSLISITLPNVVSTNTTTFSACFFNCYNLKTCVLPGAAQLSLVTSISSMFQLCSNLTTLTNFDKIGSLTATPLISATGNQYNRFTGGSAISFSGPLSGLNLSGLQTTMRADVQAVRLLNTSAGQWTGSTYQINVSFTNMSTANLVQLFNDMAAQPAVSGKQINILSATGAAGLTAADRLIVTSKGWTITG
jgi:hypothetical protein